MSPSFRLRDKMDWMLYHILEESLIAIISIVIALRSLVSSRSGHLTGEVRSRLFLIGSAFILLGINSAVHAFIHANRLNENLLYQTLLGYCLGLLTLIVAVSSEKPWTKKPMPFLYIPLLLLLYPGIYTSFPLFGEFRPLVWIVIAYLSGIVCMLYISAYYRTRAGRYLFSSFGHALICTSAIMLFFPASIGSRPWIYGHLLRPLGFITLFFSMRREDLTKLTGSILYKALTAFSLLAAVPLFVYGFFVFYENIHPINFIGRNFIVFALVLTTLMSALIFGLGLIIRLVRPILLLKDSVSGLVERGLNEKIEIKSNDEIGELSRAYNEMVVKLRQSIAEQDRLSRLAATGELSATLAHEIKNPLNAISVAAAYIKEHYKGKLIREFIKIIQNEASRINKLTTSLLNFAKPVRPELAASNINNLVRETVSLLRQESQENEVEIRVETDDSIPPFNFDYNQIKQVLLNLIINSFDAVDGGGWVKIQTRSSNGNVLLSVEDNGRGIPPENLKNIFNPFFTTKTHGTGLGLAISKKIAKEHGGDILIESVPSKGSKFTLLLPLKR
jgi:signal transduction histidine kinase